MDQHWEIGIFQRVDVCQPPPRDGVEQGVIAQYLHALVGRNKHDQNEVELSLL